MTTLDERLYAIAELAQARAAAHDTAHDALHLRRVVANARQMIWAERQSGTVVDEFVVVAAAWLHDLVQLPKGAGPAGEAARRSAAAARDLLRELDVDEGAIAAIASAIEAHSYSGGTRPETIEAAIVQDADRLDALGAIGIARLWVTGVALGGTLYHSDDPSAAARELDDRAYGLDHIERKLLRLPALMNTEAGRSEAARRVAVVRSYRREFLRELGGVESYTCEDPPMIGQTSSQSSETILEHAIRTGTIDAEIVYPGVPTPTVADAACALGVDERQIIKSLLFSNNDGEVVLAILAGDARVDRDRLGQEVGRGRLSLANAAVVLDRTGYPAGGIPPVGHAERLPVVVDVGVMELPVAIGGGGRVDSLLRIRPEEIVRVTGAKVAAIVQQ